MIPAQEGVTWAHWLELARTAEDAGIDGLFRSDHYTSFHRGPGRATLDAWTTLAALAAVTTRIRLGTIVSSVTFRHPSVLGRLAVTVDHISEGRVTLGIGAGWLEQEHRSHGFAFPPIGARLDALEEQLELILRQWTDDEPQVQPKPFQRPRLPVMVGGMGGPRSVGIAARYADEYNLPISATEPATTVRARLDAAAEREGRGPLGLSIQAPCVLGDLSDDFLRRAENVAHLTGGQTGVLGGSVQQVAERLAEFERTAGVDRVYVLPYDPSDLEFVQLVGEQLVPAVA